jgi:hypothetical protein
LYILFLNPSNNFLLLANALQTPSSKPAADTLSPSSDINALILDYLTVAGYPNAAQKFSAEANLPAQQESGSIVARQEIQRAIHRGDIATAISDLNDLDPEVRNTPCLASSQASAWLDFIISSSFLLGLETEF